MTVTNKEADQIAALLNERNELTVRYTRERVLNEKEDYILRASSSGDVIACVQVKKVQWYQCEVLHLTVAAGHESQGHGRALLTDVEKIANSRSARVLQCTIREKNSRSLKVFEAAGFSRAATFFNERSANNVHVLQKVLSQAR